MKEFRCVDCNCRWYKRDGDDEEKSGTMEMGDSRGKCKSDYRCVHEAVGNEWVDGVVL